MEKSTAKLLTQIEANSVVSLLQNLVRIQSHREAPQQEALVAEYIVDRLEKSGIDVKVREAADGRPNVIGVIEGSGGGNSLMLSGHMDTVPVYSWKAEGGPFSGALRKGQVYGRGACDMKGAIAAIIVAMETIHRSGVELQGSLFFTGVVGEEGSGSIGTKEIIRNGPKTDMAIVCEPTDLKIVIAHKGLCNLELTTKGKTAHTGWPERGVNAITKMARVIRVLEKKVTPKLNQRRHRLLGSSTLTIAVIDGGYRTDVVPDFCKIQINLRYIPDEKPRDILKEIRQVLDDMGKEDPEFKAEVAIQEKRFPWKYGEVVLFDEHPNSMEIPEDHAIVRALKHSIRNLTGEDAGIAAFPMWTDASLLLNEGNIPTAICGPGSKNGGPHSSTECIAVDQVVKAARIYCLTALEICRNRQ